MVSRQMIDPGNLVKADDTVLTTIVSRVRPNLCLLLGRRTDDVAHTPPD